MRLMGFNFTKINIEKLENSKESLKINTNINILDIQKTDVDFIKSKEDFFIIKFKYTISYEPNFAKLEFEGNMVVSLDSKDSKNLMNDWKNHKISEEIQFSLFSIILRKSNVKALQLEDEMNLPFHIPMPRLSKQKTDKN